MWSGVAAIIASVIVGVATWTLTRPAPPAPPSPKRFVINLPETHRVDTNGLTLSPDGKTLVYIGIRGGVSQLYRRSMDQLDAVPIPGTEGAAFPFFSPDGQWVGFFAGDKLKKVALIGGPAVTLSDLTNGRRGASWGRDDTIVFSVVGSGLLRVPAAGGVPQTISRLEGENQGGSGHYWMDVLPNGQAVLFTAWTEGGGLQNARIAVLNLTTGQQRVLMEGTQPRYLPTGHIVFGRSNNSLWAVPFDPERLELRARPRRFWKVLR
jgi:serine/threonine-protein kinase